MDTSEPADNPPLLPLSSSTSFSLSSSGSLQTHLSSFNSEQRLRSLPSVTNDLENQADSDSDDSDNGDIRRFAVTQRIWWLARVFIWFSAILFPISALGDFGLLSRRPPKNSLGVDYDSGPPYFRRTKLRLTGYPGYPLSPRENERLLSKITTLDLRPSRFHYSVFDGFYNSHDLTACIWLNFAGFDDTMFWLRGWPGEFRSFLPIGLRVNPISTRSGIADPLRR